MQIPTRTEIESIKRMYPIGTLIELDHMNDPHAPPAGTRGKVISVDGIGQIHLDSIGLALIPGVDRFHKITEEE